MKKIIALVLSVVMMFSCLGIAASATSVVGRSSYPLGKPECTTNECQKPTRPCPPPTCPSKPECTTKEECTTVINNVTNNNITIMPEEDPTTIFGFLYRVIKTIVPYLYKILSLLNIEISFGGQNATCGNCGSNNGCNCGNGGNGGSDIEDDFTIVIPTIPSIDVPTGGDSDSDSADSDSSDSDSDSMDSILGGLFGDLFA